MRLSILWTSIIVSLFLFSISSPALAAHVVSQTYYSGNSCVVSLDETATYDYSAHGIENEDATDALNVYCPLNYLYKWNADYSSPTDYETQVNVKVFDNNTVAEKDISCRVYGADGTENGATNYFDYSYTSYQNTVTEGTPTNLAFSPLGYTFSTEDYFFLYCIVPYNTGVPSQLLGYHMDISED